MIKCCSIDDFIGKNKYNVRVSAWSTSVKFQCTNYLVHPGEIFDITKLLNKGLVLEAPYVNRGVDISTGVGFAYILNEKCERTGFHMGTWTYRGSFEYLIEDDKVWDEAPERNDQAIKIYKRLFNLRTVQNQN